jgi:perosamine synthetase
LSRVRIPLFKVFMPETVIAPVRDVLLSGWVGQGPQVDAFERDLADWFGTPHVLTVNSGTSALHLALRLAGVGAGDEVISSPMTCIATNTPIVALGATVVWADIDPWTGNISPDDVARKITARTKAIMAVHWGGSPCDLSRLSAVARAHALPIVEDAALAFGATYEGRRIGSISDYTCFSFQATKHVTTVDGGALTCASPQTLERGRRLRWYGADRTGTVEWHWDQDIQEAGYKCHMNDVTAAIGREQLKHAAHILARHRAHARAYDEALQDCTAIRPLRLDAWGVGSYWTYTVRVAAREAFMTHMAAAGIGVSRVFARNDRYPAFASARTALPGVDAFDAEQVSIPCGWWLSSDDLGYVVDTLRRFSVP